MPTPSPDASALVGPLEYAVLRTLWEASPASVSEVLTRLNEGRSNDEALAYTTVMTVLARLTDKDLLAREKVGRGYHYTPRFDEPALVDHLGSQEVAGLVDRYGAVALAQFASALEDADPALLEKVLALTEDEDDD